MSNYTVINENIYRLPVPFRDIFTTVYVLKAPEGIILFDTASYPQDITDRVVPFLEEIGVTADMLKYVFISHKHSDHSGGLAQLMEIFPKTCIVSRSPVLQEKFSSFYVLSPEDGHVLLDVFRVVTIPGHSADSIAILDTRTMTLVTGDCLQLAGICGSGDWASNITLPALHLDALEKVSKLGATSIYTAHDYYPMSHEILGSEEITRALNACVSPLRKVATLIQENPRLDDAAIRELYNSAPGLPTICKAVVTAMRAALTQKEFSDKLFSIAFH